MGNKEKIMTNKEIIKYINYVVDSEFGISLDKLVLNNIKNDFWKECGLDKTRAEFIHQTIKNYIYDDKE